MHVCACLPQPVVTSYRTCNFLIWQIMSTAQRRDLAMNIPALRKLDAMLLVSARSICLLFFLFLQ
jgi:hypothetical protein